MKKITALLLIFCMVFCFASCTDKTGDSASSALSLAASKEASSAAASSQTSSQATSSQEEVSSEEVDTTDYNSPTLRVMSYNILHPEWCSTESYVGTSDRSPLLATLINDYAPDVVGLQETSEGWHAAINTRLVKSGKYKFACKKTNTGKYNLTTFIYNTETVNLIEENIVFLENDSDIRLIAIALFERKSDGKRFVVTNTHPAPSKTQAAKYEYHFSILPGLMKTQMEKYKDLPFIMTGDYNTYEQMENYEKYMKEVGVKDAKYIAKTLVKDYCTFSGYKQAPKPGNEKCIDHIFVNSKTAVKQFDVVIDHNVELISDHIPIYADVILK